MNPPTSPTLFLASQSPRRRELLAQLGLAPASVTINVDETPRSDESPSDYVLRLARNKAAAGLAALADEAHQPIQSDPNGTTPPPPSLILAADTAVVCESRILGKPTDWKDASAMLRLLAGRRHRVMTAVATQGFREQALMVETGVQMRPISDQEIAAYWQTGEPLGKAGAYAIQGLGAVFIERIEGSYSNVVGLPLFETAALLESAGIPCLPGIHGTSG